MGLIERILARLFPPEPEPVSEARRGRPVLIRGRVVARDEIESPLSGARCVYYRYRIDQWNASTVIGLADGFWTTVADEEAIAEFYVQDESGRAIVAPERAHVELGPGGRPEPIADPRGRRAVEARIEAGDEVEVQGIAEEVDDLLDDDRGYRDRPARVLVRAADGGVLRIRVVGKRSGALT